MQAKNAMRIVGVCLCVSLSGLNFVYAGMAGLKRLRDKIDGASGSSKGSFREMLKQAQTEGSASGSGIVITASGVTNVKKDEKDFSRKSNMRTRNMPGNKNKKNTHSIATRLTETSEELPVSIQEIDDQLNSLYWCANSGLIKKINDAYAKLKNAVADAFLLELVKKFDTARSPLVAFASDVQKEEKILQDCIVALINLEKEKDSENDPEFLQKLDEQLLKVVKLRQQCDDFILLINKIFTDA